MALQPGFLIDFCVVEPCIIDEDYFMPWLACVGENTFQRANQSNVADRKSQLFLHFTGDGIHTSLAELNTAANGAKEGSCFNSVVELIDQYFSVMVKDT
ncbi:hypothetical protein TU79_21985 [Pseudomonas trivialis]|uniref:Uncharacterized protein n=1 Tax=Pseudomonas trivialis TaxID=200450 RepID=A0A0R2ZCT4_9PSED|nr:hypothetical protein TU79_21985 [Pseudomonas trivialis]